MQALISEDYREQNRLLHENSNYGVAGKIYADICNKLALNFDCETILDYGCGKRTMETFLPHLEIAGYDPAVEEYSALPAPADLVICLDVLEHIEPEFLENVLNHLRDLTKKVILLSVSTRPAHKTLPDGRNAHLTVEPPEWWLPGILSRWDLFTFQKSDDQFYATLTRKQDVDHSTHR